MDPAGQDLDALQPCVDAMFHDADVFRGVFETVGCLALPQEVFARPGLWEKVEAAAGKPLALPGPSRKDLLGLLA